MLDFYDIDEMDTKALLLQESDKEIVYRLSDDEILQKFEEGELKAKVETSSSMGMLQAIGFQLVLSDTQGDVAISGWGTPSVFEADFSDCIVRA